MDSLIASVLSRLNIQLTESKHLSGQLIDVGNSLPEIRIGESLMLKVVQGLQNSKGDNALMLVLQEGEKEVPLKLNTEVPLKFPEQDEHWLSVRISGYSPQGKLSVQVIEVDGKKPETMPIKNEQPVVVPNEEQSPVIKQLNTVTEQTKLLPVKLDAVVDELMVENDVRPDIRRQVTSYLKNTELSISLQPLENDTPPKVFEAEETLQQIIKVLHSVPEKHPLSPDSLKQVSEILQNLRGQTIEGTVLPEKTAGFRIFSTPLGTVISETPLKIPPQTKVVFQLQNISPVAEEASQTLPPKNSVEDIVRILDSGKMTDDVKDILSALVKEPEKIERYEQKGALFHVLKPLLEVSEISPEVKKIPSPASEPKFNVSERLPDVEENVIVLKQLINKIPALNKNLVASLVSFVKAGISQNVENWLGKSLVAELKQSDTKGQEILARATQFLSVSTQEKGSWQSIQVPVWTGDNFMPLLVSVKNNREDGQNEKLTSFKRRTRFLLETEFTRLGKFQFDGLAVKGERRFDLIVRTSQLQTPDFCTEMMKLFKSTLSQVDYVGNISINLKENFIKIENNKQYENKLSDGMYV